MEREPLPVSVVIPAFRRPDLVERAVRSVWAQSMPPAEVIVVDDASGDDTGPRAAELGARVVTHEVNRGEGASRNTGIEAAAHEWVALLDCDDEWLPDHLATVWAARDGHTLVGTAVLGTGTGAKHNRVYGWTGRRARVLSGPGDVAIPDTKLTPSSVLVRRDAVLRAGGFRDLKRSADLDMWLRLLEDGSALAIPRITALYHVHEEQVSADPRLMHESHKSVLDSHAGRPWYTARIRRRHEGVLAWDSARTDWASGAPRIRTALRLATRLAHPQRAAGVAQLLAGRWSRRRAAAAAARSLGR
jgi:glycosyltransferase involved in cell wall biosynthesis